MSRYGGDKNSKKHTKGSNMLNERKKMLILWLFHNSWRMEIDWERERKSWFLCSLAFHHRRKCWKGRRKGNGRKRKRYQESFLLFWLCNRWHSILCCIVLLLSLNWAFFGWRYSIFYLKCVQHLRVSSTFISLFDRWNDFFITFWRNKIEKKFIHDFVISNDQHHQEMKHFFFRVSTIICHL